MLITVLSLVGGLLALILSAERFVFGAAALARNLRVSPLLIGVIVVGFGTSAPELMVSSISALQGNPGLAIGNAIGSNISNIALILGIAALLRPVEVHSMVLKRELPILLAAALAAWALLSNGHLDRREGMLLLVAFAIMLYWMVQVALRERPDGPDILETEYAAELPTKVGNGVAAFWLVVGLVVLLASSRLLVWSAVNLATSLGVSDLVIGLTIVAVGTSLPELAAAVMAAIKREDDIALGNIVGSNTFNTLAVLGLPGLIAPGPFSPEVLTRDMPIMVTLTVLLFGMAYGFRKPGSISRAKGALLVSAFVGYQWLLFGHG
jgi:cation:H+ antiporter